MFRRVGARKKQNEAEGGAVLSVVGNKANGAAYGRFKRLGCGGTNEKGSVASSLLEEGQAT